MRYMRVSSNLWFWLYNRQLQLLHWRFDGTSVMLHQSHAWYIGRVVTLADTVETTTNHKKHIYINWLYTVLLANVLLKNTDVAENQYFYTATVFMFIETAINACLNRCRYTVCFIHTCPYFIRHIDGSVQDFRISIDNALWKLHYCIEPSIFAIGYCNRLKYTHIPVSLFGMYQAAI